MARLAALVKKELSEHGGVAFVAALLMVLILLVLVLGNALSPRLITVLEGHRSFVRFFLPLFALVVGHRLIVREYQGQTQRFLEALPIRRSEVMVEKLLLGWLVLLLVGAGSLALFAAVAALREPLTVGWLLRVLARTEAFVTTVWAYFFMMGLFGRWRIPLYLALGVLLLFLQTGTAVEVSRFGPFSLVGETMVLERNTLPWSALGVSLGLAAAFTVVGALLALLDEGSVAEAMAKRMSLREKTGVGIAFACGLIVLDVVDAKPAKAPFAFESEAVVRLEDPRVSVLYLHASNRPAAERLAELVRHDVVELRRTLETGAVPAIHVALRPTLEAGRTEVVSLEDDDDDDAVLVRAAYTDPGFDRDAFRAAMLEEVLARLSDGRAAFEPNRWVQRGVAGWLVERDGGVSEATLTRALLVAREREPRAEALGRFLLLEERLGRDLAGAWAVSAIFAAAEASSDEDVISFAREVVARPPSWGMRAVIEARRRPPLAVLESISGLSEAAFEAAWREELAAYGRDARSARLADIGEVRGFTRVERMEGALRQIRWGVEGSGVARLESCRLLHTAIGPFDAVVDEDTLAREELRCDELGPDGATLVGRYGEGERVFLAIEVVDPALEVPWRVHAARLEVE